MPPRPIRLRLHGEEIVLVAAPSRIDVGAQVAWIMRHCNRWALEDAFGFQGTADRLAVQLELGSTTLVRIPDRERTLDALEVSKLSDLVDPDVRENDDPARGVAVTDQPVVPGLAPGGAPEPTDLSFDRELVFQVVSAHGFPLTAAWSLADTATEHAGDLVQEARIRQKVHGKSLRLQLDKLELESPPATEANP